MFEVNLRVNLKPQWSDHVTELIRTSEADGAITKDITLFLSKLHHLGACFPVEDLKQWSAFDTEALCTDACFDYGNTGVDSKKKKVKPFSSQRIRMTSSMNILISTT